MTTPYSPSIDWEAYCDALMAGDPMEAGWDEYPIWGEDLRP